MTGEDDDSGADTLLPGARAAPARAADSGLDATMASGPAGAADSGLDQTMASGGDDGEKCALPPAIVRAGRQDDYDELQRVDPRHYVVGDEIARGGMGRITAGRDRRLGRPVAIKELLVASGGLRMRFEREARITARLQHPAIVNILEAGTWPSGEPFYVMKLVAGESLDKVIAERTTLEARLALLPHVIAVVDALAYAHSMRIIHRDLKPGNVLVGAFGETVVIDWGLAKDLADTSSDVEPDAGPYRVAAGETMAGSIIGTPAYMPVEQAAGEPVDERADVYALGAMLYHLLAGAPPYTGKSSEEVLGQVIQGRLPPLADRAAGTPPDLLTIVTKAMAHDAAGRYPTARELADDLHRFQTGQLVGSHRYTTGELLRRWVRRHRAAVSVAAALLAILAVVSTISVQRVVRARRAAEAEQRVAEEQRELAQRSRDQAEDLLGFMLFDLRDKLVPIGKLEILDAVAHEASDYYRSQPETGTPEQLRRRAKARANLGEVLLDRYDHDGALVEYRAAQRLRQQLLALDAADLASLRDVAVSHDEIGEVLELRDDHDAALVEYRTAQKLRERIAAASPDDPVSIDDVARSHMQIGDVLAVNDVDGSLAEYRVALALRQQLAARDPADLGRQYRVAIGHSKVGNSLRAVGDLAAALVVLREGRVLNEALVAADDTNTEWARLLVHNRLDQCRALLDQRDSRGALAECRGALEGNQRLIAHDPSNARWLRDAWQIHVKICDVLLVLEDFPAALVECQAARDIADRTASPDDMMISHQRMGEVIEANGDDRGALVEYRAYLAAAQRLAADEPTNLENQQAVSLAHGVVADMLEAMGDHDAALAEYRTSTELAVRVLAGDPENVAFQRDVAAARSGIANVLLVQGQLPEAIDEYRRVVAIVEQVAADDPENPSRKEDVWLMRRDLGDALLANHDPAGALAVYRSASELAEQVAQGDPSNQQWADDVADLRAKVERCCRE